MSTSPSPEQIAEAAVRIAAAETGVFEDDDTLVRGDVRVSWAALGEGLDGDYDPSDPGDVELLRFDFHGRHRGVWLTALDASYCTQVPAETGPLVRRALLSVLMDAGHGSVSQGLELERESLDAAAQDGPLDGCEFRPASRRVFEGASWISPASLAS